MTRLARSLVVAAAACAVHLPAAALVPASQAPPYRNAQLSVDERVRDLLGRMTLVEKFWQLFMIPGDLDNPANDYSNGIFGLQISALPRAAGAPGAPSPQTPGAAARAHAERINAIQRYFVEQTRLGIPIIPFEEAVHGLTREGATVFPAAIAQAATFDTALMTRLAEAIARETATRGIRQVLSPVVNIADDVRWGRVEETYGEDPYLASVMGAAFVRAFERAGVVATPKHFVANVGEGGRDSYPVAWSERALAERYFPPFVAALRAGARSVMTAYNSVDGLPATQNRRLLREILKGDWAFSGFVISDASATSGATVLHMTEASTATAATRAFAAGLDVVFQSSYGQQRPYLDAFQRGLIPMATIDEAVARVLRVKFELGLFERPFVDVDAAAAASGSAAHRALARETARASIVLLRNDGDVLPLARSARSIAVIGQDASEVRLGGYTGPGNNVVSILEGIRRAAGPGGSVRFEAGPGRLPGTELSVVPPEILGTEVDGRLVRGLRGEYFDNPRLDGAPRFTRTDTRMDFRWTLNSPGRGIPFDWYSVRWTGSITVPAAGVSGPARVGVEGNDGYRLYLDDRLVIDNWIKRSYGTRTVEVGPGAHRLRLEYFEATGNARVKLVWDDPQSAAAAVQTIPRAVDLARASDVAIVVAGVEEGEFRDRAFLRLPGHQEELIGAVAATGKPTIVVLIGGSAITMPWLDRVGAVLHAWYPGEAGGEAVADVLFGDVNPSGRLPVTFPMAEGQLPLSYNHKPTGRGDDYVDLTGQPLFPFGFGLSYTTFEYSDLTIDPAETTADAGATVRCVVQNTGSRAGDEVVQLYVRDVLASVARPVMELRGFTRIHLRPGERRDVTFRIGREDLQMLDETMRWIVEPGVFRILVGRSSKDIRLRGQLTLR